VTADNAVNDNQGSEVPPAGPLAGVRVLELTDEIAVLGGRLLAALGADVLRPEPPGGDALRRRPPIVDCGDRADPMSLAHLTYNSGKRSAVVECGLKGYEQVRALARMSDIVLLSRDSTYAGAFDGRGRDFADAHPATAVVWVEPFPSAGAFAGWQSTDLILSAMGGFVWLCGDVAGPPEHPKGQLAYAYTGAAVALAGLAGLAARETLGRSGWFELSGQEAVAFSTFQSGDPNTLRWYGTLPGRGDWMQTARRALQQCRDGRWCTFVMLGTHFENLAGWFSEAGVSDAFLSDDWLDRDYYVVHQPELTEAIAKLCRRYDRDEVVRRGQSRRLMVMPVTTAHELLADAQLAERQMFVPVDTAAGSVRLPRAPSVFSGTPVPPPGPAPVLGEHTRTAFQEWLRPRPARVAANIRRRPLPLDGLRVADFSWMLAAPIATRILADLGADVIRIESHTRRDMTREIGPQPPGQFSLDTNSTQHHASSNKRSIALDLHHPEAVALAHEIISRSDVVFENFSPGTMAKWGLDPQSLLEEWPGLIVVSQPAVGATGPHRRWGAIGNGVAGYGGINMLSGFPQNLPVGVGPIVVDFTAPLFSTAALLAALHERRKTGRGQHVDCGMLEATLWLLDVAFAEAQVTGHEPARTGNRSAWMSPHGVYPCAGDDEWIAIAVRNDAEMARAAAVLGQPALASDPRFLTFEARKQHEDELEALVAGLTRERDRWDLAEALQRAGVPAGPIEHVGDHLSRDSGMAHRFSTVNHPYGFEFLVQTQFIRPDGELVPNRRAPMIGEHSETILRDLLGKREEKVAELVIKGILN